MSFQKGRKLFSLNFLLSSFFGALFIASAFAYYDYKFSKYNTIDFKEWILYTKNDIFTPQKKRYIFAVISSRDVKAKALIEALAAEYKEEVLVLDLYQDSDEESSENITYLRVGTNTILKIIQRFNIYEVPIFFEIEKFQGTQYKQESPLKILRSKDA